MRSPRFAWIYFGMTVLLCLPVFGLACYKLCVTSNLGFAALAIFMMYAGFGYARDWWNEMKIGDRVQDKDDQESTGTITEIYTDNKPDMRGRVKVDWGEGAWSWERKENLEIVEPK